MKKLFLGLMMCYGLEPAMAMRLPPVASSTLDSFESSSRMSKLDTPRPTLAITRRNSNPSPVPVPFHGSNEMPPETNRPRRNAQIFKQLVMPAHFEKPIFEEIAESPEKMPLPRPLVAPPKPESTQRPTDRLRINKSRRKRLSFSPLEKFADPGSISRQTFYNFGARSFSLDNEDPSPLCFPDISE